MPSKRINITLTEAEIAEADRQAEGLGLSRSALIGQRIMQAAPKLLRKAIASERKPAHRPKTPPSPRRRIGRPKEGE